MELLTHRELLSQINEKLNHGEFPRAAELAQYLAEQYPEDFDAQLLAGDCLQRAGKIEESLPFIDHARSLRDNCAAVFLLEARAAQRLNQRERAFESINHALALDPDNPEYLLERGSIFMNIGDRDNAIADFHRVLSIDKRSIDPLLKLSAIPGYRLTREQLKMAEFLIQSGQLHWDQKGAAHFTLARAYEREEKRDRQFRHLSAGNAIYSQRFNYDPQNFTNLVSRMIDCFPAARFNVSQPAPASSARLIFIVGMPRSGSTLLEQILCSHSQVVTVGENNHLANAITNFQQHHRFPDMDERSLGALHQIAESYLASIGPLAKGSVIVDKTLPNYMFSGLLRLLFPDALFIYTQRNPVATCYGAYKQLFSSGLATFSYDMEHLAARYRDTVRIVRHWLRVMPERFLVLDYETLVENQVAVTREVLEFCSLPWEDACLDFHKNDSTVATASNMQVKQKLYASAVSEWRQCEIYLQPLLKLLGEEEGYPVQL